MTTGALAALGVLAGAVVGALLPRLIALIPDREVQTHGVDERTARELPGTELSRPAEPVSSDPSMDELLSGNEPAGAAARSAGAGPLSGSEPPGSAGPTAATPYRALAAAPHLPWVLGAATAVLWAVLAARMGWGASMAAVIIVAGLGVAMAYIDIREHRLPDWLTYPAFGAAAVALAVAALATGEWSSYGRAWAAAAVLSGSLFVLALIRPGELGYGDVKLAATLGMLLGWVGWGHVVLGGFLSFLFGGMFSVVLLALRRAGRRTAIPFGPFLLAGTFTAIAWGDALLDAYLG